MILSTPNGVIVIEGKHQWLSGLLSKFLRKSGLDTENTDGSPKVLIERNGTYSCTRQQMQCNQ
jgi:hypothetical protein